MNEPIIPIDIIIRDAHLAVDNRQSLNTCPYPPDTEAANRWRRAYYAREMELLGDAA